MLSYKTFKNRSPPPKKHTAIMRSLDFRKDPVDPVAGSVPSASFLPVSTMKNNQEIRVSSPQAETMGSISLFPFLLA